MLKLATVFSGIGAVEHALKRMEIPYEIVFACDNGDVNIFSELPKRKTDAEEVQKVFDRFPEEYDSTVLSDEADMTEKGQIKKDYDELLESFREFREEMSGLEKNDIRKRLIDFSDRLSMCFERLRMIKVNRDFSKITDYKKQKEYVDGLYKDKEKSNKVRQSYFANYDITDDRWHWNVSLIDGRQYRGKVDLFVGGSPCQSFSRAGHQRGLEDTRGTLFYEYARLVKEIQPKIFIYENVNAMLTNDHGRTWKTIQNVFTEIGYDWHYQVLNAVDYGIPQSRKRIFVVGFRKDLKLKKEFTYPKPIPLEKTMKDFLLDNVSGRYYLREKAAEFVLDEKRRKKKYTQVDGDIALCQTKNQQYNLTGDFIFVEENTEKEKTIKDLEKYFLSEKIEKYVLDDSVAGYRKKPKTDPDIAHTLVKTMHKMHRASMDNYVTTDGRLRRLTPRECLRLMGFCDSFKIVVSDTAMYQQAGNSIVVDVLIALLREIFKCYNDFE